MNDLKFALRQLRRNPGFTAIAVLSLALGIGANIAIFSLINSAFLRPLPYTEPERLVHVAETNASGHEISVAYPNFLDWHDQQKVFSGLAIIHGADGTLQTGESAEIASVQHVSADFFDVLDVKPALGRSLTPEDDRVGAERAVWVTDSAWERFFERDPKLVGRSIVLDGQSMTVAGILPPGFRFYRSTDLITAIAPIARQFFLDTRQNRSNTQVIARLAPGVSLETARANLNLIATHLSDEYPEANKGVGVEIEPCVNGCRVPYALSSSCSSEPLPWSCSSPVSTWPTCCSPAPSRGNGRWRSARRWVHHDLNSYDSCSSRAWYLRPPVAAAGTLIGVWGYQLAARLVPSQVQRVVPADSIFDLRMVLFIVGLTILTGICFGLMPAWQLSHVRPAEALKRREGLGRALFGRIRMSDLLVVAQVALALVLLIGAGLLIRSLENLLEVKPGYDASRVLTLEVGAPPVEQFQRDPQSFARHYENVLASVERLPEVEAAAVGSDLPFSGHSSTMSFYREDQPIPAAGQFPNAHSHSVSSNYFRAMGIPLLRGRLFDGTEPEYVLPKGVILTPSNLGTLFKDYTISGVISRKMAERFWPGEDPIGKRFHMGPPSLGLPTIEVIGIVGNTVQFGLDQGESTEFYLPLHQWPQPIALHLLVRTKLDPAAAVNSVRTAITSALPRTTIRDVRVLSERIDASTADRRFNGGLFTIFAMTAFVLAIIGIYGVLAFNVGRRTREIGIRMALGGNRRDVVRSVLSRGLVLVVPGLVIGLGCAFAGARLIESQLFEVSSRDPLTYAVGAALLLATAVAAACIPARRAASIDPMRALREE